MSVTSSVSPQHPFRGALRVAAALWIGGLWTLACAVVPLLFWRFPPVVAGGLAGDLFGLWQGLGLLCGGFVVAGVRGRARPWPAIAWAAWLLDALFELLILPVMAFLRSQPSFGPQGPTWGLFMGLHALATAVYLTEGVLGLALIARAL